MYEFAGHRLDLRQGRLLKDGRDVHLRPKALSLLGFLVENAGRVMAKDELVSAIWPGVAVTDDSLTQCIRDIRRALGPDAGDLLRNVPRRGYIIDADRVIVSEGKPGQPEQQSDGPPPDTATFSPVVVRILPSPGRQQAPSTMLQQVMELVGTHLAELRWLTVAETHYQRDPAAGPGDPADYSLLLTDHGSKVPRIGARLLQSHARKLIVAHSVEIGDVDDFASITAAATEISGLAEDKVIFECSELLSGKPRDAWNARDNFVYGRLLDIRHQLPQAEPYFSRAVELRPDLGFVHSNRAVALIGTFSQTGERHFLEMADEAARTALRLDSNDAWANCAAGASKLLLREFRSARTYYDRSFDLAPGDLKIAIEYAEFLHYVGKMEEAVRLAVRTLAASRRPPVWFWLTRGIIFLQAGRLGEAADDFQKVPGLSWRTCLLNAAAQRLLGNRAAADDWLASAYRAQPQLAPALIRATFPYADISRAEKLLAAFG